MVAAITALCSVFWSSIAAGATHESQPLPGLSGAFLAPAGVATDSQGNIYVSTLVGAEPKVKIFDSTGAAITEFAAGGQGSLAVDSNGNVYVASGSVKKFHPSSYPFAGTPTYSLEATPVASRATAVAVDPVDQDLYVAESSVAEVVSIVRTTSGGTLGGTYRICKDVALTECTGTLAPAANAATVKTALEGLFGAGNIASVSGLGVNPRVVTFGGALAGMDIPNLTCDASALTPAGSTCSALPTTNGSPSRISSFQANGTPISSTIGTGVAGASYVGVDVYGVTGNVYATDAAHNAAYIFNPAGSSILHEITGPPFSSFTSARLEVNQANGHVLISNVPASGAVLEYSESGALVTEITHSTPPLEAAAPTDIAVDNSTGATKGSVYITSGVVGGSVFKYGPLTPKIGLSVTTAGSGTGTVSCDTGAGPETCDAEYEPDTHVVATATPDPGSSFSGWSGDCSGTGTCTLTLSSAKSAVASFGIAGEGLTITKEGTGGGTIECEVNSGPAGTCASTYPAGTSVKLKATANAGSEFAGFGGDCSGSVCELTMSGPKSVTATFSLIARTFSATKAGTGDGTVECEVASVTGPCAASYPNGTVVKVIATPGSGSQFDGFSAGTGSATACSTSPCTFTIEANSTLTATFNLIQRTFSVTKAGAGDGTIECKAGAGSFGACAASYPNGTALEVKATANSGSLFDGFSGGTGSATGCTTTAPCSFTIEANSTVTATFNLEGEKTLTITPAGTGTGTIECKAGAGSFGACAASYPNGTSLEVKATANSGSLFDGFSGGTGSATGCTTTAPCTFTIEANSTLTATFNLIQRTFSVTKAGTGDGTVECEVNGGGAEACAASYPNGTNVKLKATPVTGSQFDGFSGDCTGSTCELTMTANKAVTATFNLIARTFSVTKAGAGDGTIECKAGAGSFGACAASYPNGTALEVKATANGSSQFTGFSAGTGSASGCTTTAPCSFTITANSTLTATFNLIQRTLSITKAGTGDGTIECKAGAGSFGACAASYPTGTALEVKATANAGSQFAGFSAGTGSAGSCSISPCAFTIEANSTLTATFNLIARTFSVTKAGTGTGTVECEVASVTGACAASYPNGTVVKVKATPGSGSQFAGFSAGTGSATACSTSPCTLTIEADSTLTATFNLIARTFSVTKAGTGTGTVECKAGAGSFGACAASYPNGTALEVKATANSGSQFDGFSAGTGSATACSISPCTFTIEANSTLTATFNLIQRTFSVTKAGTGDGTIECEVASVAGACAAQYPNGTQVKVKATPGSGSQFAGFSAGTGSAGACSTSPCTFTITANSTLTATFSPIQWALSVSKMGTGSGTVECKVGSGSFGACAATYPEGTTVTLSATPAAGSTFVGWAGSGCAGTSTCEVTLDSDRAVTASFAQIMRTLTVSIMGGGTVTCNGVACASSYPVGTKVTLAATAAAGSSFTGWEGGGCSGTGSCVVTLDNDTTVIASFEAASAAEGTPKVASSASVSGGEAALKISCKGAGACSGTVKLTAKIKQGKKTKNMVIGKSSYKVEAGKTKTVKVKLNGPAKQLLKEGKTIKAKLGGPGMKGTVKLKPGS